MLGVTVQGGTGAGVKRPLGEPRGDWRCPSCSSHNPGYRGWCGECDERRPEKETA